MEPPSPKSLRVFFNGRLPDIIPQKEGDVGVDLYLPHAWDLEVGTVCAIDLKTSFVFPDATWGKLEMRSSAWTKAGVALLILGGIIDTGYRGHVSVNAYVLALKDRGGNPVSSCTLPAHCRILQMTKMGDSTMVPTWESGLAPNDTERGRLGYGSTGPTGPDIPLGTKP